MEVGGADLMPRSLVSAVSTVLAGIVVEAVKVKVGTRVAV